MKVQWWAGLYSELCFNISHWIFAFKYWTLAIKVQMLKKGQDPNKMNRRFIIVFAAGIVANVIYCFLIQFSATSKFTNDIRKRNLAIAAFVFLSAIYASWIVLCDAFRRFSNSKRSEQVISNLKVSALLLSYLIYAVGYTVVLVT